MSVEVIISKLLGDVPHGFLGRVGGVSTGIYAGLNCSLGSDDAREDVLENGMRAIAAIMPGAALARVYQIHSPEVFTVAGPIDQDNPTKADALVTDMPNNLPGVQNPCWLAGAFFGSQASGRAGGPPRHDRDKPPALAGQSSGSCWGLIQFSPVVTGSVSRTLPRQSTAAQTGLTSATFRAHFSRANGFGAQAPVTIVRHVSHCEHILLDKFI